jgi:hypothetical protein
MPRNFSIWPPSDPRALLRLAVGVLVAANIIAAYFVIWPVGGSAAQLRQQAANMRMSIVQKRNILKRTELLAGKIETGRVQGDQFLGSYFLPRRQAYSMIVAEMNDLAGKAKIMQKESSFPIEEVDGSDNLQMMQVTANFEASYQDLIHFINLLDKSDKLLVVESLNASPQQNGSKLNVMLKLDTFVTGDAATP